MAERPRLVPDSILMEGLRELTLAGSDVSLPDYASSVAVLLEELRKAGWMIVPSSSCTQREGISVREVYEGKTLAADPKEQAAMTPELAEKLADGIIAELKAE